MGDKVGRLPAADAAVTASPGLRPEPASGLGPEGRVPHGAAHTPGPWGIETTADGSWIGPMRAAGDKVGEIVVKVDTGREYRMEYRDRAAANARLIAAAPQLYEAGRQTLELIELLVAEVPQTEALARSDAVTKLRAALAKARAEQ